jgi:hypothetical protein
MTEVAVGGFLAQLVFPFGLMVEVFRFVLHKAPMQ